MSATSLLHDAEASARAVAARVLAPPPPVDYSDWAARHIIFGSESAFPGRYDPDLFPFYRRILDCLSPDHPCREVVLRKSIQIGGTVVAQVFTGGSLDMDPGPFMYVHPSLENGRRWSNMKWAPMVRQSPALARIFNLDQTRDSKSSIFFMERRDGRGSLLISGANSPSSLSQVSVPRQVQDDLQRWELNAAGDPQEQADGRSEGFEFAKILRTGTGAVEGECRMTRAYEAGTQEIYEVPCPHCGVLQDLAWENMFAHLDEERPDDAHFVCRHCEIRIDHHHKREMVAAGRWRAQHPEREHRTVSFHIWAAYSPLTSWERIARRWLESKGTGHRERVFVNEMTGLPYRAEGDAPEWEHLRDRAMAAPVAVGTVPADGLLIAAGIDCQVDRVEVQIVAASRDRRSHVIDYLVIDGHISAAATQAQLDALLDRRWPYAPGGDRALEMLAIDAGHWSEEVYEWAGRWPEDRVMAVKGATAEAAPPLDAGRRPRVSFSGRKRRRAKVRLWIVGVSGLKSQLYSDLRKDDLAERGAVGLPRGLPDDYYQQLTAERRAPKVNRQGYIVYRWTKPPNQPNEALDTMIYARAALIRLGWHRLSDAQWDALEAQRLAETQAAGAPQCELFDPDRASQVPDVSERRSPAVTSARSPEPPAAPRDTAADDSGEMYL